MEKLKKHQKLEKAMKDYPHGTRLLSEPTNEEIVSTGVFWVHENGNVLCQVDQMNSFSVYVDLFDKWAEFIHETKPSILDGKVAIQVNNEREFKLLMEHYEGKGWIDRTWITKNKPLSLPEYWTYGEDDCYRPKLNELTEAGYKVIPFSDFEAEVGIKVPKLIMKSEDGSDMFEGDLAHWIRKDQLRHLYPQRMYPSHLSLDFNEIYGIFSTKEAAELWIKQQNKPKEIIISINDKFPTKVVYGGAEISTEHGKLFVTGRELEVIYDAYKSLQS